MEQTPETAPEPTFETTKVGEAEDKAEVETGSDTDNTPAQSDEVPAEGSDAVKTEENFVGNYKTKEDAEKGFKEAQRKITELGNEKAQLTQSVKEFEPYLNQPVQSDGINGKPLTPEEQQQFEAKKLIKEALSEELAPLKESNNQLKARTAVSDMRAEFPEFDEVKGELKKIMDSNPDLQNREDGLRRAMVLFKSDPKRLQELAQNQRDAGIKEGVNGVIQKQAAASEKPAKSPQIDEAEELFQKGFGDNTDDKAQVAYFKKWYEAREKKK